METKLIYEAETYEINGVCFEVYREKGCGLVEPVYQECMEIEHRLRGIPFVAQRKLTLEYKGAPLKSTYEPDLSCFDLIVVELKAVTELADEHRAQLQNYLKAPRAESWSACQLWALSKSADRASRRCRGTLRSRKDVTDIPF